MAVLETEAGEDLRERLEKDLRQAEQDAPDGVRAATLRLVACALRDRDLTARTRGECSGCKNDDVRDVLMTMAEQRRVSAREFDDSGRIADAERERDEQAVLEAYLPKPLAGDALQQAVHTVVEDLEATTLKDLGRCISVLKQRFPGRIEAAHARKAVREALQS